MNPDSVRGRYAILTGYTRIYVYRNNKQKSQGASVIAT